MVKYGRRRKKTGVFSIRMGKSGREQFLRIMGTRNEALIIIQPIK